MEGPAENARSHTQTQSMPKLESPTKNMRVTTSVTIALNIRIELKGCADSTYGRGFRGLDVSLDSSCVGKKV